MSFNSSTLNGLVEGDRICVKSAGGASDSGVFIRIEGDFLIWVKDDGDPDPALATTSLIGINITKLT